MKGYKVMITVQTPRSGPGYGEVYYEEYTGKIHTDPLTAHEELWLAQHDGEVMDPYLEEVEL